MSEGYASMRGVTEKEYKEFLRTNNKVRIEDAEILIGGEKRINKFGPDKFELECTSVYSFPKRGNWATHKGDYRGNWAPQIPRNIILRYSKEEDVVLDQMVGGGTSLIECKLLGRKGVGVDINEDAIMLTRDRLDFDHNPVDPCFPKTQQSTYVGDARNLDKIKAESIDLIATHPPYANIISYTKNSSEELTADLSRVHNISEFVDEMMLVAQEAYRVLKSGKYCAILIGDTRRHKHYVSIASRVMGSFLDAGFILKEDIIKKQWQCKTTSFWAEKSKKFNFHLIMHEHLYVFRKPDEGEDISKFRH